MAYIFGVANFQLFWDMSDTSDTFFGVGECLVQVYVARKIERTPLSGGIRRLHHFLLSFKADSHTTVHGFVFLLWISFILKHNFNKMEQLIDFFLQQFLQWFIHVQNTLITLNMSLNNEK